MDINNRTIVKLFNNDTGEEENSLSLLSQSEESNFQLRRIVEERIQQEDSLYSCGVCGQPVVMRSHTIQDLGRHTFYFKHKYKSGDCPIKTATNYTKEELQAMKYNGAKESKAHIQTKNYIASCLEKDSRFSNVKVEEVVKGKGWSKQWKKPDISACFNGQDVVFEVQLSTTFLDVIVSRELFYQNEGMPIFWIFRNLEPQKSRATEKDVFFNNKSNALSICDDSKKFTGENGELTFIGHYKAPTLDYQTKAISDKWMSKPITFEDIKFDEQTLKPYFVSYNELLQVAEKEKYQLEISEPVNKLEALILAHDYNYPRLKQCCKELEKVDLFHEGAMGQSFMKLIMALLSVRDGQVYFKNQEGKWTWLVNYIWEHHKQYWVILLYTVRCYDRTELVFDPNNEKLNAKRKTFENNWRSDKQFEQDTTYYPLFSALLPNIRQALESFQKKVESH